MCEYCGCQAVPAISMLTREHDYVATLISQVRATHERGDAATMAALARRITATLGPHVAVEEGGLFAVLAGEFPAQIERLAGEHRYVEEVLGEAAGAVPTAPDWPARMMDAMWRLREHILDEEDDMFPAALSRLDPSDWDAVDALRDRVGSVLPAADLDAAVPSAP